MKRILTVLAAAFCICGAAHSQPTIATQPANQNVLPGGTAVFSVAASGAGPLSYQWQFQGTNLPASFITIEAGDGYSGYYGDGDAATNAELNVPEGIAFDATGNLYIADTANSVVRKVAVNGNISTVAGNGVPAYRGDGGPAAKASLNQPQSVAVDAAGNLYIADTLNSVIRKVNAAGIITTFAGNGRYAYAGDAGLATEAALNQPSGVAMDNGGNLYIADTLNSVVRRVNAGGNIATVAGNGTSAYSGDGGLATEAALNQPSSVAVDPWGNLYIADTLNSVVRMVNASGTIKTVAGNGTSAYSGDGGPATNASLSQPAFVTLDSSGNLYIADSGNDVVREVTATGLIDTVAGGGLQSPEFADDATNANLIGTGGLAFRGAGHLYISDPGDAFVCQVVLDYSKGAMLSMSDVSSNNVGDYDVVVSDGSESVVSSDAILTLEPTFTQNYFPLAVDTTFAFDETNSLNLQIIYQGNYLMTETYPGVYEALDLDADANSVSLVEAGTGWVHASFNPPALLVDNAALQNGGTLTTSTTSEGYAATYSVAIGKAGTITVPAGTFYNCRSFTASESLDGTHATALTAYLAPGVGIIKLLVKSGDWAELTGGTVNGYDVSTYAGMQLATTSPTLSITSPKSGLAVSNDVLAVTGSAAAAVAMQSVYYQLNGGSWMLAASANSWTNWTANVNLTPGANTISVYAQDTSGNTSPTITISNFYVLTGSLQVTLLPPVAVADGALWKVDNGAWETNGVTLGNLLVGSHALSFKPVGGFKTPANQTVSISSNFVTQVFGTYFDTNPPSVTILSPAAGQRVSNSLFTVTGTARDNVAVASVYVQVNGAGWVLAGSSNLFTNWNKNVTLSAGSNYVQAYATDTSGNNSLTNGVTVTYVVTGSSQVTLLPPVAVADGARWQVDGGAWDTNAATLGNLLVGSHVVAFKPVVGFKTPANQTVSISSNLITQAVGTYFDTNLPTWTLVSPTAGQRVSNGVFTVTGKANDNVAVASVHVRVNGTGWNAAGSSNWFTNWTNNVTLSAGSNYVQVYATDTSGNNSLTNGVPFVFVPSAILTVRTNGNGGISPVDNGKLLAIGTNYTLTATAGNNWLFSNWVGGVTTPYAVLTNGAVLQFAMQSNLVLQANFVTNPFLAGAGSSYYGLFTPANAVRQNTKSGAFTFTYGSSGTVSGTIWLGPDTVNLSSNFDVSGRVRMVSVRHGESNLITTLQLDFADGTVGGQVTDGSFVAQLGGYRDVWTSRNPATNYQGSYTVIIPGTNDASVGPLGTGFGTVTVDALGNITFSGSLADGTTGLSQHSVVSQEGLWAFCLPLHGGTGSFWAWNLFTNGTVDSLPLEASWVNTANATRGALYRSGFTNQEVQVIGSPYNSTNRPLLGMTNGVVVLEGGGLAVNLTNSILLATNNTITVVTNTVRNTNHLNLSIDRTHGTISGSFTNPTNANQTISINGVLMQNLTNAAGYFTNFNQSGTFLLENP
jgi:hypothetical protein